METEKDNIDHVIFHCEKSERFWNEAHDWVNKLDFADFQLSVSKTILGELEDSYVIKFIISVTKKIIFNAKKCNRNNFYNAKIYIAWKGTKHMIRGKENRSTQNGDF